MLEKKQEWGLENTYIFVKERGGNDEYSIFKRDDCIIIGDEERAVYNIKRIDDDTITAMTKMTNRIYSLEFAIASKPNKMFIVPVEKIMSKRTAIGTTQKHSWKENPIYTPVSVYVQSCI